MLDTRLSSSECLIFFFEFLIGVLINAENTFQIKGLRCIRESVHETRASLTFNWNSFEKLTINWNLFDLLQSPGNLVQFEGLRMFWVEKLAISQKLWEAKSAPDNFCSVYTLCLNNDIDYPHSTEKVCSDYTVVALQKPLIYDVRIL